MKPPDIESATDELMVARISGDRSKARFFAHFIDQLASLGAAILSTVIVPMEYPALKWALFAVVYVAYFVPCEAIWSRTLGKFVQGLVIRKLDGRPCGWKAAWIRFLMRFIECNPMILGDLPAAILVLATKRKQRFGDMVAGTVVVRTSARFAPPPSQPASDQSDTPIVPFATAHIWLGQFLPGSPDDFFEEQSDDSDAPISAFAASQGERRFDVAFVEISFAEELRSVRSLVEGHSFYESYLDAVASQAATLGIEQVNVFVLADKEQFAAPRSVSGPQYQLWYLGEFQCAAGQKVPDPIGLPGHAS